MVTIARALIAVAVSLLLALAFAACGNRDAEREAPTATTEARSESATPATDTPTAGTNANGSTTVEGPAAHEGERAMAHVKALAETIGPRVAGTAGEERAAEYIAGQLRSYGYAVETPTFEFTGDRFRAATLKIGGTEVEAIAMDGSGGSPTAKGAAVFVGLADSAGIAGRNLAGQIAVADRGTLTFAEKYESAYKAGAAGLVILNNAAGQLNGRTQAGAVFPVLGVAGEDAEAVRQAAKAGQPFELVTSGPGPSKGTNVIARSKDGAQCDVVVGGHYDTVPSAPGANDNASGTANVIELARAMAADGIDQGFCFAAFSAEESGLFGSEAFAAKLKAEGHLPKFMVNVDVTGIGDGMEVIGEAALVSRTLALAGKLNIDAARSSLPANTGSDHLSFQKANVPAVWFFSGEFQTIHSPKDVARDIDVDELDRAGDLAYALLLDLAREVARR